jgi:Abnormal spindle-like microcephaly-assoc'd, ASPM-SPD-2-Hydin
MNTLPRSVSRFGAVLFLFAGALATISLAPPAAAASGILTAGPSSISAGSVVVGNTAILACSLTNRGTASLTISKAASSNSAYGLSSPPLPLTLAAGKVAACAIRFAPKALARVSGTVTFTSNASNPTASIFLRGWGTGGRLVASLPAIAFGNLADGSSKTVIETLTNNGSAAVKISSANATGSAYTRSGITPPLSLSPGASITFNVLFAPKTSGATTGSIAVVSNAINPTLSIALTGTGTGTGSVAVAPPTASFGSVTVGSSKTMTATLTASGTAVVVASATTTNPEFSLSGMPFPTTLAAGSKLSYTLKFAPKSSGATSANISFKSSSGSSPTVETVTGTGAAATSHRVTLHWGASSTSVSGYNVYRGSVSGGPYTRQTSSLDPNTSYLDSNVQAGQTYYYTVTSKNSQGAESGYSNQVKAAIPTP